MNGVEEIIRQVILRVYDYMEKTGRPDSFERFPYLEIFVQRGDDREFEPGAERGTARYEALLRRLSDGKEDAVLKNAVDLALAATLVTEFAAYLNYYTGNRATIQLAFEMCGVFCPDYAEVKKYGALLERAFCMEKKNPIGYANMEAGQELLFYLAGGQPRNDDFGEEAKWFLHTGDLHPMYVREELVDQGVRILAEENAVLHICGSGGKRFLVKHVAKRMERDVLFVKADQICGDGESEEYRRMRTLRSAFLRNGMVCIREEKRTASKEEEEEETAGLPEAVQLFWKAGIRVILCTERAIFLPDGIGEGRIARMEWKPLSRAERERVWKGFAKQYDRNVDTEQCSIRYQLNASEIAHVFREWESGRFADAQLSNICYQILCTGEKKKLGTVIRPYVGQSDLIISERSKRILEEICHCAMQGHRIYEDWGLERQYPYGRNVSLLLAGPPGTGKTMTAHVLAHEIGVPLYQVDLSHIMDKYIGETEKHLEQAFDFAAKTNMVLFFDEADALFAKRGEVTEGKDRYANMEVSYLLQRIEQFDGVVVLATNFYHHIDKAFLRRIKYVLKYQEPDEEMRKRMWESCLVPALPREAVDTDYLAKQFALSGGEIKNVFQSACISAAYEKRPLQMEHVLRAVRMEYEKLERNIAPGFWGEYEYLMEQPEI